MWRVEDKYIGSLQELLILQARVGSVLKADRNQYADLGYCVTSVYFDDYNNTSYMDTINGIAIRRKYRIRIYNGSLKTIKLEIKDKKYNRVSKKSQLITEEELRLLLLGRTINCNKYDADNPIAMFNLAIIKRGIRPKVVVEYDRKAYIYQPGNVRITFDRNIRMSNQISCFGTNQISYNYLDEPNDILEVKYDDFLPRFIAQILESGNMIQTSYSKYMLSRERNIRECQQKM